MAAKGAKNLKFIRLGLGLSVMLITLTGCVVGPNYHPPQISTPFSWSQPKKQITEEPAQLAGWWRQFNDPQLVLLVDDAISGNNDVASAKAKVREARANLWQTIGTVLPNFSGTAAMNRSGANGGNEFSQFRGGFDSSWEIDLFGADRRAIEAANYGLDASEEELRATMVTLIGDVASNYVTMRGLQQKLALAKRTAIAQRKTADLTRDKFTAGAVSRLDVANAEGQAASTEASIPQLEANISVTIHRLAVLTGRPPASLDSSLKTRTGGKLTAIPRPKWPIASGIPADILLTRPDIRVAERQYAAATAKVGQKIADLYPKLTLTGNIATKASEVGDLGRNSTLSWSFGPGLSIPLFNGGQRKAAVEVAEAQRDQSFIVYRAAVLTGLEDVENALVNLTRERVRSARLASSAKAYETSLKLSRSLYETGNTSFLELLNAERSSFAAEQASIDSRVAIANDYIALMKALGGGWDGGVDTWPKEIIDRNTGPHILTTLSSPSATKMQSQAIEKSRKF